MADGIIIISLPRRFDFDSAPSVENELRPVLGKHPAQVLFDFSKTEYISSAGVRVLLASIRSIKEGGGTAALSSLCREVTYILEIAGFTKIFTIYDTRENAVRMMKEKH
ncbi:MAG: STAS domain-containing protein [Methanoregula sp.]